MASTSRPTPAGMIAARARSHHVQHGCGAVERLGEPVGIGAVPAPGTDRGGADPERGDGIVGRAGRLGDSRGGESYIGGGIEAGKCALDVQGAGEVAQRTGEGRRSGNGFADANEVVQRCGFGIGRWGAGGSCHAAKLTHENSELPRAATKFRHMSLAAQMPEAGICQERRKCRAVMSANTRSTSLMIGNGVLDPTGAWEPVWLRPS